MKALRLHEPVGAEGLVYEDEPDLTPALNDILMKVHAGGINPATVYACRR
jgi:NADPH:quinone reductase-like Zn-dependent oxidoreductase